MTTDEKKPTEKPTLMQRLDALKIPQAVVALCATALAIAAIYAIPPEMRPDFVYYALGLLFTTATGLALPSVFRPGTPAAPTHRPPVRLDEDEDDDDDDDDGEAGFASQDLLGYLAVTGLCTLAAWRLFGPAVMRALGLGALLLFVATPLSGCGSSLTAHATAAHVMGLALDGAYDLAEAHAVEATDACVTAGSEECVLEVRSSMEPVAVGLAGFEVAWSAYVSAIEVGHLSGASDALLEAMRAAAVRMLGAYSTLADAMSRVHVMLPAVPPMVLALVGASS